MNELLEQVKKDFDYLVEIYLDDCSPVFQSIEGRCGRVINSPTEYSSSDVESAKEKAREDILDIDKYIRDFDRLDESEHDFEKKKQAIINYVKQF